MPRSDEGGISRCAIERLEPVCQGTGTESCPAEETASVDYRSGSYGCRGEGRSGPEPARHGTDSFAVPRWHRSVHGE